MNWHAVPVAILVGVTGYAALLFTGLYFALAEVAEERARREYLTFALTCVAVLAYDVTCVGLYNSHSLEQGYFWMRGNWLTAASLGVAYQAFVWDFLKRPMPLVLRCSGAVLVALGLVACLWESEYTATIARPAIKHVFVLHSDLVYYECEAGIIAQILLLTFFLVYLINVAYLFRHFRSREGRGKRGQAWFVLATAISGLCATNDFLVTGGVYTFLYAFEYGIAAILMAMSYVLLMRFGELHEAVNVLNRNLSRANADLVVALERAQESARLKTEFLASISHELRTPLNAIINLPEGLIGEFAPVTLAVCDSCNAEFQLDPGEKLGADNACGSCGAVALAASTRVAFVGDAENAQGCLQIVTRAAKHLLGLVNDVLDASKLELDRTRIVPAEFDPFDLVSEVVDAARSLAEKSEISVLFQRPANDVSLTIVADRVRIGQVLYNLLSNAIKFSPQGGVVEVSLSAPSGTERELCVRDHGIGIAEEHHAMIFEKFRQVEGGATRTHGGTGLGLAISKGLVELHGGRIWVESKQGQGTAFFVRLPQTPPQRMAS